MIDIKDFPNHIASLSQKDWEKLFELLPHMERIKKFGEIEGGDKDEDNSLTFHYWSSTEIVDRVFNVIIDLGLAPIFNWSLWHEGKSILTDKTFEYSKLDTINLCKLLTVIIRADRFNDGFMISYFENGVMTKIIKSIKRNINNA